MKKDLKGAADNIQPVYQQINDAAAAEEAAKQQAADIAKEVQEFLADTEQRFASLDESLSTQGHRGKKLMRINLAFSDANYDYIKIMAALNGETMTEYINRIIDKERKSNQQYYILAKNLQAKMADA